MTIDWRKVQGKYGMMYFANSGDFLSATETEVPVEIRTTYQNYINTKDPKTLAKKGNYYTPDWVRDDWNIGVTYKATYDDQYSWGVMKTEMSAKKKADGPGGQTAGGGTGGQATLPTTNIEAALEVTNARLKDIQDLLEDIRDMNKIMGAYFAEKGMTTADKMKAKDDAAAAAAEGMQDPDDDSAEEEAGNEEF